MAFSEDQIDQVYLRVLARHASTDEQIGWATLSKTVPHYETLDLIFQIPEMQQYVDPIIRLYGAAFGRPPDYGDLHIEDATPHSGFWANVNVLRSGLSIADVAEAFVASREFHNQYGSTQLTAPLIISFYSQILGRQPSSAEVAAWQATGLDTAHVLTGFTESAEATHNPYVVRNVHQVNSLASEGTPPYFGGLPPLGAAEVKVVGLTEPMHIDHS